MQCRQAFIYKAISLNEAAVRLMECERFADATPLFKLALSVVEAATQAHRAHIDASGNKKEYSEVKSRNMFFWTAPLSSSSSSSVLFQEEEEENEPPASHAEEHVATSSHSYFRFQRAILFHQSVSSQEPKEEQDPNHNGDTIDLWVISAGIFYNAGLCLDQMMRGKQQQQQQHCVTSRRFLFKRVHGLYNLALQICEARATTRGGDLYTSLMIVILNNTGALFAETKQFQDSIRCFRKVSGRLSTLVYDCNSGSHESSSSFTQAEEQDFFENFLRISALSPEAAPAA